MNKKSGSSIELSSDEYTALDLAVTRARMALHDNLSPSPELLALVAAWRKIAAAVTVSTGEPR